MLDGAGPERVECFDAGVEFFVGPLRLKYRIAPDNIVGTVVDERALRAANKLTVNDQIVADTVVED